MSEKVGLGIQASYSDYYEEYTYVSQPAYTSTSEEQTVAILPRFDFYYVRTPTLQLYSGVGVGVAALKRKRHSSISGSPGPEEFNETKPAIQANLVGLRAGKRLAGFAELGVGYNGFLQLGLAFRP